MRRGGRTLLGMLLLSFLAGRVALGDGEAAGVVDARRFSNLGAMEAACAEVRAPSCTLVVTSGQRIVLAGAHALAAGIRLRFLPGGRWDVVGGALTVGSGVVEGPADARLFAEGSRIRGLSVARPEWFGDGSAEGYGAEALAEAYRSTVAWGRILLREAVYLSPFFDPSTGSGCGGAALPYNTPRILLGTRRPWVDDERDPRRLVGGTIVRGEICGQAALDVYHLGVDEGPWVVKHLFGGRESYGIQLGQGPGLHRVRGTVLEDVAVLTNGMESQHSVIIEGQDEATVRGLWIWSQGGTHGLVIKSSRSTVRDYHCRGATADCLIVKSDAATDGAGYASDVAVDGVEIAALKRPGDTGGVAIDAAWDTVHSLTLDHLTERGTSYGIAGRGSIFHTLREVRIRDWTAEVTGHCLYFNYSRDVAVERFGCGVSGGRGDAAAVTLLGDHTTLTDGVLSCVAGEPRCGGGTVDGIVALGGETRLTRVVGDGLTGYLVRAAAGSVRLADGLTTRGMDGRLSLPYRAPVETGAARRRRWVETVKPELRIVVTALVTRARRLGWAAWGGMAAGAVAVAFFLWRALRLRQIRETV